MSDKDEKNGLKMYPGVSLGSARKKGISKFKITLLLIIVIVGASAGGYWINSEFISSEKDIPEVVEIIESDPAPAETVSESTDSELDLDISLSPEPQGDIVEETALNEPDLANEASTLTNDDLALDNILEEPEEQSQVTTIEPVTEEETSIIDDTISAASDAVDVVTETITEAVSDPTPTIGTKGSVIDAIKLSDAAMAEKDYPDALSSLSAFTSLPAESLGKLAPDVYYRAGLANRYLKNETEAQNYWLKAYQNYPNTITGRLAALALADTWYYWYVESNRDFSKWESIRDAYSTAIGMDGARFMAPATEAQTASRLTYLNQKLVFDPTVKVAGAIFHKVEPGEYISTIASEYGLGTWSSIVDINKVNPKNLKVGMTLKVMPGRLFVLVDKRNFTLSWYLDGKFIKRYKCAVGAVDSETPAGHYEIFKMDAEPNWTDPKTGKVYKYGEEGHAIGSRWLAMRGGSKTGLGIHGTIVPESIGTKASNGCIRLLNKDVEELYGFASIANNNESEVLVIE